VQQPIELLRRAGVDFCAHVGFKEAPAGQFEKAVIARHPLFKEAESG
jgi:hypothetical protein